MTEPDQRTTTCKPNPHIRKMSDGKWYWVSKSIVYNHGKNLGVFGVAVYNCLALFADSDQTCYPSQQRIADMLGCSRAAVNRAIKRLEADGLIAVEHRGIYPQLYHLLEPRCNSHDASLSVTATSDVTVCGRNKNHVTRINNNGIVGAADVDNGRIPTSGGFQTAIQNDALAIELAESLGDRQNLDCYLSFCRRYPESLLREAIQVVAKVPPNKIRKSKAALFKHLVRVYAKQQTNNPGY